MKTYRCISCEQDFPEDQFLIQRRERLKVGMPFIYEYRVKRCTPCEKLFRVRYQHTPNGKDAQQRAHRRYYQANKDKFKAYWQSDRGKDVKKQYLARRKAQPVPAEETSVVAQ